MKFGDRVKARHNHPSIRPGRTGTVVYVPTHKDTGNPVTIRWDWTVEERIQHTEYASHTACIAECEPLDDVEYMPHKPPAPSDSDLSTTDKLP